jgi:hypothetical protein
METEKYKLAIIKENGVEFFGLASSNSQHFTYLMQYIKNN